MSTWRQRVEMVSDDHRILGEGEDGELYVPSSQHKGWWDRRFNPRNPRHWHFWLRSRRLGRIAFLSHDPDLKP